MAKKTEQVLVRLTEDTKEEWERRADKNGYSVPELVRHAVNEFESSSGDSDVSVDMDPVVDTVESVDERTQSIEQQLSLLNEAVSGLKETVEGEVSDIEQQEILEHLPEKSELTYPAQTGGEEVRYQETPRATDIAHKIDPEDPPIGAVTRTLEQLALQSPRVKSRTFNDGDERGYYLDV